jgi:DnaJ-class molecular chaperone
VVIPAGTRPGTRIRALHGVVFEVQEKPHEYFKRISTAPEDLFLCVELPWSVESEMLEGHVIFGGAGGEEVKVPVPRDLAEATRGSRVVGKGMPVRKGNSVAAHGDLYIR